MTSSKDTIPPRVIQASQACPPLPRDIRVELQRRTSIPLAQLSKAQVLNLFRQFSTSEVRKNLALKRVADLYDNCRAVWIK